jgi:hypothetical protein
MPAKLLEASRLAPLGNFKARLGMSRELDTSRSLGVAICDVSCGRIVAYGEGGELSKDVDKSKIP